MPKSWAGYVVGRHRIKLDNIAEETKTQITISNNGQETTFIIQRSLDNSKIAKTKIKKSAHIAKTLDEQSIKHGFPKPFPWIYANEGRFTFEPCQEQSDGLYRPMLKSQMEDNVRDYGELLEKLKNTLREIGDLKRKANVRCNFGQFLVDYPVSEFGKEFSLADLQSHLSAEKRHVKYITGLKFISSDEIGLPYSQWLPSDCQTEIVRYNRFEIAYVTPSFNELRVKTAFLVDNNLTNGYKSIEFPHQLDSVIKTSDAPPYFYICESIHKQGVINVFQPSSKVDFRLTATAIRDFDGSEAEDDCIFVEATTLYDHVLQNLHIDENGNVDRRRLTDTTYCPEDYDFVYFQESQVQMVRFTFEGLNFVAQLSSYNEVDECNKKADDVNGYDNVTKNWNIRVSADEFNDIKPEDVPDKVPKLLNCAGKIARAVSNFHQSA